MIVADSSAWIELLRRTESLVASRLRAAIEAGEAAVTEVVVAEVLSGLNDDRNLRNVHALLLDCPLLRLEGLLDFEEAAALRRACRRRGEAVRSIADCLVAVPAIAAGLPVLAADRDFEVLARHTPLELVALDG